MYTKSVEEMAVEAFVKNLIDKALPIMSDMKAEINQFVNDGLSDYLHYHSGKILQSKTLLHRSTPRKFYEIYQPIKLNYAGEIIKTDTIEPLFEVSNFVTIIGRAGSGKSTLFKHLFLTSIKERYVIPIFIELRSFNSSTPSIYDYIKGIVLRSGLSKNEKILERLLKQGQFIFFLDGFDELNSEIKSQIIKELTDFFDQYNKNKYFLSSRPSANIELLPMFHNMEVEPLDSVDIVEFTKKQVEEEMANKIIESINSAETRKIRDYLTNPLLLSLYILCFKSYPQIPKERSTFYRRVIDVLMTEHDSLSKLGFSRERKAKLSDGEYYKVLSQFCFVSYFEDQFSFNKEYIYSTLSKMVERDIIKKIDAGDFLYDMEVNLSLWVDDDGEISFLHRSIQEYFAALFLAELPTANKINAYEKVQTLIRFKDENEIENLLFLLEEMDQEDCYKYLLIPMYEELIDLISDSNQITRIDKLISRFFTSCHIEYDSGTKKLENVSFSMIHQIPYAFITFKEMFQVFNSVKKILEETIYDYDTAFEFTKESEVKVTKQPQIEGHKNLRIIIELDKSFVTKWIEWISSSKNFSSVLRMESKLKRKLAIMKDCVNKSEIRSNQLLDLI